MRTLYLLVFTLSASIYSIAQNTVAYTNLLEICENDTLVFRNNSTLQGGATILEYAWDFDGDMSYDLITTQDTAYHIYTSTFLSTAGGQRIFNTSLRVVTSLNDTLYSISKPISVNYLPVLLTTSNPSFDSSVCKLDTVFFFNNFYVAQGTVNNTYWYFNDEDETYTANYFSRSFDEAAVYNVKTTAYTDKGCQTTVYKNLYVKEIPNGEISYSGETLFYNDKSVDLTVTGEFDTIVWSNNKMSPTITVNTSGTYVATLTNNEGCKVDLTSEEIIVMQEQPIDAMNLLTLNDDGKNDVWKIYEIEAYGKINVSIFNRNGVLVYENPDYQNTWDGKDESGNKLAEGAYFYVIRADELPKEKKGTINLLY